MSNPYRPNETVIQEGDAGESLLVIITGLVRVTRTQPRGGQTDVTRLGMGQCIGEMSLLTGRPRSATVEAVTDCEVVEIPKVSMNELFLERPELVDDLARTMSERRAAEDLVGDRDAEAARRLTLQDIAARYGPQILTATIGTQVSPALARRVERETLASTGVGIA